MKYIKNRNQFKSSYKIFEEAPSEQIYDGTWEDTFAGMFFSFLGRKVKHKIKKGGLNKLLKKLENELENVTFINQIEEESEPVQFYRVYQNIVIIKNYIKNSDDFKIDVLKDKLESAIEDHKDSSENDNLPNKVKKAHKEIKEGMQEVLNYVDDIQKDNSVSEKLILEFLTDEGSNKGFLQPGEILAEHWTNPIKGDVKLSKLKMVGNQSGYKDYKDLIKKRFNKLSSNLNDVLPYIDDEIKPKYEKLIDLLKETSFDDYTSFANDFDKNIKPLISELISKHNNYLKKLSKKDDKKKKKKEFIEDVKKDPNKILLKWKNKKGDIINGYIENDDILDIIEDGKIDLDSWDDLDNTSKIKISGGGDITLFQLTNTAKRGDILKIGDNDIKNDPILERGSEIREKIDQKMDEVFPNDNEYKNFMEITDKELKQVHEKLKSKKENQMNVVDPISILKIFNRAYNSFSIKKEEYNDLSNRYSPKVASRKKARYELVGDTARDKKLFSEWNDGVLSLLQQYGDLLNKNTKKFIIEMLDNNKMFGDAGSQAKLLSSHFDVTLDDIKPKIKSQMKESPAEHKVKVTEDKVIKFSSVPNIEMNTDKIRRIPFVIEVVFKTGERRMMTLYPLSASKGGDISSMMVKFTIGNDYGFIKKYMKGINVELDNGTLEELGMDDNDSTPVHVGKVLSHNGFIEKGNQYKLSEINRLTDQEGLDDKVFEVKQIYMLLGSKDEGIYRLPSLNKEMKKSINDSKNDRLI